MKSPAERRKEKKLLGQVRIGFGYDVHRFAAGRRLVIGGVRIASTRGLLGHSDADVLLHAICDALLGAAALPDIGRIFPNSDEKYHGISSLKLLKQVDLRLGEKGFRIGNIDSTVILEEPQLAPHIETMRHKIGKTLHLSPNDISIKATTNEGLGAFGKGEGCAAFAVVTIITREKNV